MIKNGFHNFIAPMKIKLNCNTLIY